MLKKINSRAIVNTVDSTNRQYFDFIIHRSNLKNQSAKTRRRAIADKCSTTDSEDFCD